MNSINDCLQVQIARPDSLESAISLYWEWAIRVVQISRWGDSEPGMKLSLEFVLSGLPLSTELSELSLMSHLNDSVLERRSDLRKELMLWRVKAKDQWCPLKEGTDCDAELVEWLCDARVLCEWLWDVNFFSPKLSPRERFHMLSEAPLKAPYGGWKEI